MLSNRKNRDKKDEEKRKRAASFKYDLDGLTIELNIYINIYNNNDNKNNLANEGSKAGVTYSASSKGQISGDNGLNEIIGEVLDKEVDVDRNQSDQIVGKDGENIMKEDKIETVVGVREQM